ncbi:MAG: hypothetical protein QHJ73_16765, partial [Armatimonadota bacterium]|nr:hypothetical protein [Armatimonadota bacterium]
RRTALELAFVAAGLMFGVVYGGRAPRYRGTWPPNGSLFSCPSRSAGAELAHAWWQHLGLLPLGAVALTFATILASAGFVYPGRLRGPLFAADLLWMAILAGAVGHVFGRALLRPEPHAFTPRGVYLGPECAIPWSRFSRATADPAERVVRLYACRRPWAPTCVFVYQTDAEFESAREAVATHLPFSNPAHTPREEWKWAAFLVVWVAASLGVAASMVALVLAPVRVLWSLVGAPALQVALGLNHVPEVVGLLAYVSGAALGAAVDVLRGAVCDHSLSEEA